MGLTRSRKSANHHAEFLLAAPQLLIALTGWSSGSSLPSYAVVSLSRPPLRRSAITVMYNIRCSVRYPYRITVLSRRLAARKPRLFTVYRNAWLHWSEHLMLCTLHSIARQCSEYFYPSVPAVKTGSPPVCGRAWWARLSRRNKLYTTSRILQLATSEFTCLYASGSAISGRILVKSYNLRNHLHPMLLLVHSWLLLHAV